MEVELGKETSNERGGNQRRPCEIEVQSESCQVENDLMKKVRHKMRTAHCRQYEVEVLVVQLGQS